MTDTDHAIISAYKSGKYIKQIVHEFDIYTRRVYQILHQSKIPLRQGSELKKSRDRAIRRKRHAGVAVRDLAAEFQLSETMIRMIVRKSGGPRTGEA